MYIIDVLIFNFIDKYIFNLIDIKRDSTEDTEKRDTNCNSQLQQSVLDESSDEDDIVLGTFEVRSTTPVPSPRPPSYMDLSDDEPDIGN